MAEAPATVIVIDDDPSVREALGNLAPHVAAAQITGALGEPSCPVSRACSRSRTPSAAAGFGPGSHPSATTALEHRRRRPLPRSTLGRADWGGWACSDSRCGVSAFGTGLKCRNRQPTITGGPIADGPATAPPAKDAVRSLLQSFGLEPGNTDPGRGCDGVEFASHQPLRNSRR